MKNIFIAMLIVLGTTLQAQSFDFSCAPATYKQSLNNGSGNPEAGTDFKLDLGIGTFIGTVEFTVNGETYEVTSDGTSQKLALGDISLDDMFIQINSGGSWSFWWIAVDQDNVVTWTTVYDEDKFGDLIDFLPSSGVNVVDLSHQIVVGNRSTKFYINIKRHAGLSSVFYKTFSKSTITHQIGGSTIHQSYRNIGPHATNTDSEDEEYDSARIDGGIYDRWVLVKNGNSIDVIAKWSEESGVVDYALIIHKSYKWPTNQGTNLSNVYTFKIYEVPSNTNYDN